MNSQPNKDEILKLENRYWDAMKNHDVETAVSLTKFPCTLTSPRGIRSIDENEYRKNMQSMTEDHFKNVKIENPEVTVLNNDAALIAYNTEIDGRKMVDVSTWVREGKNWVCAYHSENPLQ